MNLKPEFQTKFLQYLNKQKQGTEGFTLIELLVVIIIIGILAAIALPSLLGQANKARQAEARNNCGAIVRGLQAYVLEANSYSTLMANLGLGIKPETENYAYIFKGADGDATTDIWRAVTINCTPNTANLKAYVGAISNALTQAGESAAIGFVCESKGINDAPIAAGGGDPRAVVVPPAALTPDQWIKYSCDGTDPDTPQKIASPAAPYDEWKPLGG